MFNFEKYIADARFAPYQASCTTLQQQQELYLWNIDLSQEMNKVISHAEIFLREAIDQQLRRWNSAQQRFPENEKFAKHDPRRRAQGGSEEWLKYPSRKISNLIFSRRGSLMVSEYDSAFKRARKDLRSRVLSHPRYQAKVTHDDVLAHVTLGAWKKLLPDGRLKTSAPLKPHQVRTKNSQLDLWSQALCRAFPMRVIRM